ncbi:hypothetical protein KIPB_008709 [Kipferlia bialata]|uniref:Uncharacterized protein n=1 Tax=Kipferlia bialata TaxID=797122 RepID=A0A391NXP6_9EUKA|nr:hypothetical protein KIPB_008709 [Kipferlia bialata]|eukprot:g8709.t1
MWVKGIHSTTTTWLVLFWVHPQSPRFATQCEVQGPEGRQPIPQLLPFRSRAEALPIEHCLIAIADKHRSESGECPCYRLVKESVISTDETTNEVWNALGMVKPMMSDGMSASSIEDEITSRLEQGRDINSQQCGFSQ